MATIKECVKKLADGVALTEDDARETMKEIMSGQATDAQKGAFLSSLSLDSVTPEVVAACAEVMRNHALPCNPGVDVIDVVGTGGDGIDTFNVSTAASIVVAASGGKVLKHGNRSNSSKCGSADILEAFGANLMVDGDQAVQVMNAADSGFCFLFAQKFHPAMRHVGRVRRELGIRTIFNILGPLTNPSRAAYYLTGVYHSSLGSLFANTFKHIGVKRAMVVHSAEGLDEFSPAGPTHCWFLDNLDEEKKGIVQEFDLSPEDFGLPTHPLESVKGGTPQENMATFKAVLGGAQGPVTDYTVLNAAAALYVAGMAPTYKEAAKLAQDTIKSGKALKTLETYIRLSAAFAEEKKSKDNKSILETIAAHRTTVVEQKKKDVPLSQLLLHSLSAPPPPPIDVIQRLRAALANGAAIALMAEIKRASPSKGDLYVSSSPLKVDVQAMAYASAGAAVISVLTEPKWFKGTLDDLRTVSQTVQQMGDKRPAVLLKDFVVDAYQLAEARAHGADTALLIVRLLEQPKLKELIQYARQLGMEPLVEAANEDETKRAVDAGAKFIGINNRNLHTFKVDMNTTTRCAAFIPKDSGIVFAALSGIKTREDVEHYERIGASAVLVGETLMKAADSGIQQTIHGLLGISTGSKRKAPANSATLAKTCGLTRLEDVKCAAQAGAQLLGLIFAKSKRQVTPQQASALVAGLRGSNARAMPSFKATTGSAAQRLQAASEVIRSASSHSPLFVGVFMNQPVDFINSTVDQVGIDLVQLHGAEDRKFCESVHAPVVKVVHVSPSTTYEEIRTQVEQLAAVCVGVLLDTSKAAGAPSGGTGTTFDWSLASRLAQQSFPVWLAGGLKPTNVMQAIQDVQPFVVDVSSGVETDTPGVKDHTKVLAFLEQVTTANSKRLKH